MVPSGSDPGLASWTSGVQKEHRYNLMRSGGDQRHAYARPQEEVSRFDSERLDVLVESSVVEPLQGDGLEVFIAFLGQGHVVENDGEQDNEQSEAEVVPLDAEEVLLVDAGKECLLDEYRRDDHADGRDTPCKVETGLGELAGAGEGDEQIGGYLNAGEAEADDEIGDEEAGVRAQH